MIDDQLAGATPNPDLGIDSVEGNDLDGQKQGVVSDIELQELLDKIEQGPVARSLERPARSQIKVNATNPGDWQWMRMFPGKGSADTFKRLDDPWIRWGWLGHRTEARFNVLAVKWIHQILCIPPHDPQPLGIRVYRGLGNQDGTFKIVPCLYDRTLMNDMTRLMKRAKQSYYCFNAGVMGQMQMIGFSYLEREGDTLVGKLGDWSGYQSLNWSKAKTTFGG